MIKFKYTNKFPHHITIFDIKKKNTYYVFYSKTYKKIICEYKWVLFYSMYNYIDRLYHNS